ncbi:unnamed protein product [Oppiella nova]|uniref:Uncharacterized protein n=1 Tax=Oppiella nova TaxID=334625 RepID=A0A7R9M5N4_9ACAR|nr:unnamed protein product [Oppiella nova]CAG2171117.1 unnamed protein product [Oppiella nova]
MYLQMKHKKRNQTINHNEIDLRYGKDSMDRFGDDLCRLLLSYHSFEEHFRHECVSKQFQRSLYDTVDDIVINDELMDKMTKSVRTPTGAAWGQRLPLIMEKCPNIQRIDCREMALNERLFSLQIIRGNCRRLREIYCDFTDFEGSLDVFQWFGSLFKRLNVDDLDADPQLYLTLCPHLSHLKLYYFNDVFSDDSHQRLLVKNLRKFEFYMDLDYNNDMFDTFIAGNQSLKSLVVSGISPEIKSLDEICKFMNALKKLPELRELVLNFADIWTGSLTPIGKTIVAIGSTLKRLKRFDLTVHVKILGNFPVTEEPRYELPVHL